jgi:hypothetical protein
MNDPTLGRQPSASNNSPFELEKKTTLHWKAPTMLLLDYQNVLIQSVLTERFSG